MRSSASVMGGDPPAGWGPVSRKDGTADERRCTQMRNRGGLSRPGGSDSCRVVPRNRGITIQFPKRPFVERISVRKTFRTLKIAAAILLIGAVWACFANHGHSATTRRPTAGTERVVYLVSDLPTFLHYLSMWDGDRRFPIFMARDRYFDRFVRAYKPDKVLKVSAKELGRVDHDLLRAAVCAAWGEETIEDFPRGVSVKECKRRLDIPGKKPAGIVLTHTDAKQLPAALALAAAHRQVLDFLNVPSSVQKVKLAGAMSFEQKETVRKAVIETIEQWGYEYRSLGDEMDFITLALDFPIGYMGTDSATGTQQRLCLDDGINRLTPDGSPPSGSENKKDEKDKAEKRGHCYAYVGRLLEAEEGMSLYQAMCSIFLDTRNALYFDRWPEKWGLRCQEGAWVMQTRLHSTVVKTNDSSMAKWRQLVGKLNPFGFVHVNSAGGAKDWGDGKVSDIPESIPTIVYFAHSFSASDPYDETTIAGKWLRNGAYIYFGAMSEPFAQSFNMARTVAVSAVAGEPLGKAFQAKEMLHQRFSFPWKQIYIGDPLHRIELGDDRDESQTSRKFRQGIRAIREADLGTAIETLEEALEGAENAAERQLIWQVLNKTFRLRFFTIRTGRAPPKSHLDAFFIDSWYNDTHYPNGEPAAAVALNSRLNLFLIELLRLYEGLYRTIENRPRLKEFLAAEIEKTKKEATFAKIWLCVGPFTEAEEASADNPFRPEKALRLAATWDTTAGKIGWQANMVNPENNYLDLAALYKGNNSIIYVAYFPVVQRDKSIAARLHVSATDRAEAWLNNATVASVSGTGDQRGKEEAVDLELKPGENLLLLKLFRKGERCGLTARLTDPKGQYLEDVSYSDVVVKLSAAGVQIDPERWRLGK